MSNRNLVDPELLPMLDVLPSVAFTSANLQALRAMMAEMAGPTLGPDLAVGVVEERIGGGEGSIDIRVLIYKPKQRHSKSPALLHMHGGGFVVGAPEMSDARNRLLSAATGCVIVSVDYRLAPETPHPGPVEDCYAALKWLHRNAASLGVDQSRIAIGGESAGGGLAAALALLARDRNEVPVAFQLLVYPMLDDRTATKSPPPVVGKHVWTHNDNFFGWSALLGQPPGGPGVSAYAAAARAQSLAGLPPTFISVGSLDLFAEENLEYARRLTGEGVPVEMHLYPGAFHRFDLMASAKVSRMFERDYQDALRRALFVES